MKFLILKFSKTFYKSVKITFITYKRSLFLKISFKSSLSFNGLSFLNLSEILFLLLVFFYEIKKKPLYFVSHKITQKLCFLFYILTHCNHRATILISIGPTDNCHRPLVAKPQLIFDPLVYILFHKIFSAFLPSLFCTFCKFTFERLKRAKNFASILQDKIYMKQNKNLTFRKLWSFTCVL